MTSVGNYLKKEREARNLDLQEVAELTKISARYLSCIERDDYDQLPPGPYAKGYIAAYARQVCGDESQALALYSESCRARRRNNGGTKTDPAAPLSPAKGADGLDAAAAKQGTKATRRIDAFRRIDAIRPKRLAGGFKFAQSLRNLLPEGGNLRHLSASGTANKSAFSAKLKWVSTTLTQMAARLGKLPKAVVLKGLVASSVLLLGALILVLAGFGAYHLFVFKAGSPQAPQAEVGPPPLPEQKRAVPEKVTASSATVPSTQVRAVDHKAVALPKAPHDDNLDGEMKPAATAPQPGTQESSIVEKAASVATDPPDAPSDAEPGLLALKKAAPELKPKPTTPTVAVQQPAEIDQTVLATEAPPVGTEAPPAGTEAPPAGTEAPPAGTKVPLVLYKSSICTAIEDRMPAGVGERFAWTTPRIFVWSLLSANDPPVEVHHRYFFEDELVSDVTLKVGSSYWRTWSFHTLSGQLHIGAWHVDITTEDGRVLRRLHFAIE